MSRTRIMQLLLIALCVAVAYAWVATPRQRRAVPKQGIAKKPGSQRDKVAQAAYLEVADLDFADSGTSSYHPPRKNLFAPLYRAPKPVRSRPIAPPPAKVIKPAIQPQRVAPKVVELRRPEPIQPLKVLGYLNKGGKYTVFLASGQGDVFLVKTGDTFAQDLVVRDIDARQIIISRGQTDQQVVLRLGEAKSQRLPNVRFRSDRPAFEIPQDLNPEKPGPKAGAEEADKGVVK